MLYWEVLIKITLQFMFLIGDRADVTILNKTVQKMGVQEERSTSCTDSGKQWEAQRRWKIF
jgi:hypothetical protein